ncbi:MAG TPA: methylated-DNA--[protein]-cysteine S-methyltransferase [Bdellovibrionota bacterium]|nr:methylated-DNA--[protein]-cysteine S-methyltransferase [Bdellovibrionota bacterium]
MNDYQLIESALLRLDRDHREQPSLERMARDAGVSPFHFQRVFTRWAGISPKRMVQYLTADYAKARLRESRSVLDVAFDSGLSGPGRLHDLLVAVDGVSPGEYKSRGEGWVIEYGFHHTPFGECLAVWSPRGLCGLSFVTSGREAVLQEALAVWPRARFKKSGAEAGRAIARIFGEGKRGQKPKLHLSGTSFQIRVWEALLRIPEGHLVSYADLARAVGLPKAARAVGNAVGANPIAYLIPCHRVIRETGIVGKYRWGGARKRALIAREAWAK